MTQTNDMVCLCFNTMILYRKWTHTQVWYKILYNTVPGIAASSNKKINRKNKSGTYEMYFVQLLQQLLVYANKISFLTWNAAETAIWRNHF